MKVSLSRCPYCHSPEVYRSHRRGFAETILLPLLLLRPVRCYTCMRRHLRVVLAGTPERPERSYETRRAS